MIGIDVSRATVPADRLAAHLALADDVALERGSDLAAALDRARCLARDLVAALQPVSVDDCELNHARDLAQDLITTLSYVHEHDQKAFKFRTRLKISFQGWDLSDPIKLANEVIQGLEPSDQLNRDRSDRKKHGSRRVAPSATHLLAIAVNFLPAGHRERYAEEFMSELWELAHAGEARRHQIYYALTQLVSVWPLRAELRISRQRQVVP
jgi:hypothetical protein